MGNLCTLSYPGGKYKAIPHITPYLYGNGRFNEFREPFMGGASLSVHTMRMFPKAKFWMNDAFRPVYCFWKSLRESPEKMIRWLLTKRDEYHGRQDSLCEYCNDIFKGPGSEFEMGCAEYVLRKLTWGCMAHSGTYRKTGKFSESSIVNLLDVGSVLQSVDVTITNDDYSHCVAADGSKVLIFADPPYMIDSILYGKNGVLHRAFNHQSFSQHMKSCQHDWLITYNDCEPVRTWYADYNIIPFELVYTLRSKRVGPELMITNF